MPCYIEDGYCWWRRRWCHKYWCWGLVRTSHQALQRAGRRAHIPERALPSNFDPLLAPHLFFLLHNRMLALVNRCFHSRWDTQCKCAALMHRCDTTRIKKSNMGASMSASYRWNYFLLSRFPSCVGQSTTFYWALNRTLNCHLVIQKDASLPSTLLLVWNPTDIT